MRTDYNPGSDDLYPMLKGENGEGIIHPDDRKYGALLVGGQGTGKCIGPDDLVLLDGRLLRAEDAWERYANLAVFDGEGWWSRPLEPPLTCALDDDGRIVPAPVRRLYRQHVRERLRRVRLSDGSELTITRRHRLRGPEEWTSELREGDTVCAPLEVDWPSPPAATDLRIVGEALAWQLAAGRENGDDGRRAASRLQITHEDLATLQGVRALFLSIGELCNAPVEAARIEPGHATHTLSVESDGWRELLARRGYRWSAPPCERALPDFLMCGDRETSRVIARVFATARGRVYDGRVEITTESRMLAEQLRILLRRFAILASFPPNPRPATSAGPIERDHTRLTISGEDLALFAEHIGFATERTDQQLQQLILEADDEEFYDTAIDIHDILDGLEHLGIPTSALGAQPRHVRPPFTTYEAGGELALHLHEAAERHHSEHQPSAGGAATATREPPSTASAIDTNKILRRLERRLGQAVFYLTVEHIEEIDHAGWVYDFDVPDHHNYTAGGILAHNTSALLSFYINDIEDPNAAPLVLDPKSELSHICLKATPPHCHKRVWFLDLGHPAFGMNPLRLSGDRPLPVEAGAVADNVVAALLDINENQLFMSSRRYLNHAVIGAIALAHQQQRRAKFEDVYNLLLPTKQDFHAAVAQACADHPDLDQTAAFYRDELPNELRLAGSATAQRLDAPRNKISLLLQVPSLRRFFNHPTDVPLREIIEARDILIVDANMGALGEENSKACMKFLLRMLHTQMQRQVHQPETERPRVPVLIDEAHYIAGGENIVDQIATHRRAGLEPAFGLQYFAQLGSGSQHEQKIRKGVLNLLQSRFLFRMGDAQDAEEATRIAMAVYATMIRDDPDSRARLRVTPEQALNFPNHFCLASWIANGTRIPSFIGQTYPLPDDSDQWANHHLNAQAERVAPYPEQLESTLDPHAPRVESNGDENKSTRSAKAQREYIHVPYDQKDDAKCLGARWDPTAQSWYIPDPVASEPFARWRNVAALSAPSTDANERDNGDGNRQRPGVAPAEQGSQRGARPETAHATTGRKREVRVDYEPPPPLPNLADSPVRRIVGRRIPGPPPGETDTPAADSLRELAYLDRINEIGPADQLDGAARLSRLYDEDYAILALLDRAGLVPRSLIGRAVLPDRTARTAAHRLTKLYRHGLIAQHTTGLAGHGQHDGTPPLLYSLTRRGLEVAQTREPPAISRKREWRAIEQTNAGRLAHDLHALSWAIELHHHTGKLATDHWRTARYATGRYPVPQTGTGRDRHPITLNEIPLPDKQAIIDLQLQTFLEIRPDLSLELRIETLKLTFDLLVELDLTGRPSYNHDKLLAYDAFLSGWSLAHPRYRTLGTRPAVVFVCTDAHAALTLAREADEALTGRIGVMGTTAEHWYYPGRDHTFFAIEPDIHHANLTALALPPRPPGLRERLTGDRELEITAVQLLPDKLLNH